MEILELKSAITKDSPLGLKGISELAKEVNRDYVIQRTERKEKEN